MPTHNPRQPDKDPPTPPTPPTANDSLVDTAIASGTRDCYSLRGGPKKQQLLALKAKEEERWSRVTTTTPPDASWVALEWRGVDLTRNFPGNFPNGTPSARPRPPHPPPATRHHTQVLCTSPAAPDRVTPMREARVVSHTLVSGHRPAQPAPPRRTILPNTTQSKPLAAARAPGCTTDHLPPRVPGAVRLQSPSASRNGILSRHPAKRMQTARLCLS